MEDPRSIVKDIRANTFGAGTSWKNPLAKGYHEAIRQLAACIYQKDLHFVMELVQNADDNDYAQGVEPELEFVLVEEDIAGVGVEWTLLVLNNEIGFSRANVESLCSIGCSTKKGRRDNGYIGEKGIGFKSVFLVTRHPIVISNGFRIKFHDSPTDDSDLGFIVPEWAEQPTDTELSNCLGVSMEELPTTIIVLPIRQDKVEVMHEQLFQLSSQLVLFLNKLDKLSARKLSRRIVSPETINEDNCISVHRHRSSPSPEISRMVPNNCSYSIVYLSSPARESAFHIWQQEFPVESNHEVDDRRYIKNWTVTLAFPLDQRSDDGSEPNLYAFLPMKAVSGFPFIVNADFLLVSSRDALLFDSNWNKGILRCIPHAFISAFMFFLMSMDFNPSASSIQDVYHYIPFGHVNVVELILVRETILWRLRAKKCISCDKNIGQQFPLCGSNSELFSYCLPSQARMIDPAFRLFLEESHSTGVLPPGLLRAQKLYVVDAELQKRYEKMLSVIGVTFFTPEEYLECLRSPDWIVSLPDMLYVKLLLLLSKDLVKSELLRDLPLMKYVDDANYIRLLAPCDKDAVSVHISKKLKDMPILTQWTPIFQRWLNVRFMPNSIVKTAINVANDKFSALCEWLKRIAGVTQLSVKSFAVKLVNLCKEVPYDKSLVLGTTHFILHAIHDGYVSEDKCGALFSELPLIDRSGNVHSKFRGLILLPASVCKWPRYLLHESWNGQVLCLSEQYLELPSFMNDVGSNLVCQLLRQTIKAVDIFEIEKPPDAPLHIPSPWGLAANDVISFLTWLKGLTSIPIKLQTSLKENAWVKTAEHGDKKPWMSFVDFGQWRNVLTSRDVPFVDTRFYGDLRPFKSILNELGFVTKSEDGANAVAAHVQLLSNTRVLDVQTAMASKWYNYLRLNNWMGWKNQNIQVIWVPSGQHGHGAGCWKSARECVISDKWGLFHDRLYVLDLYYKDEGVLKFFKDNIGVAEKPGTEKHCQLWVDWGLNRETIEMDNCYTTWCTIAKGWASFSEERSGVLRDFCKQCRIPCVSLESVKNSNRLCLARPSEVLYADNLIFADIIHHAFPSFKFAWYPRSADAAPWVDELVKCYMDLGVKRLSDAVVCGGPEFRSKRVNQLSDDAAGERPTSYISRENGLQGPCPKGEIGRGLYRTILGYLADPKLMISVDVRKRMVMQLKNVEVWHVDKIGDVEIAVSVGGKVFAASRASHVRWEKGEKKIYVAAGKCSWAQLFHELASEVAKGIVGGERVMLVQGLQELLLLAAGIHFEDDSVQYLLRLRNLRLTSEDEAFLSDDWLETETTCFLKDSYKE